MLIQIVNKNKMKKMKDNYRGTYKKIKSINYLIFNKRAI
jgi:hypothetical protein